MFANPKERKWLLLEGISVSFSSEQHLLRSRTKSLFQKCLRINSNGLICLPCLLFQRKICQWEIYTYIYTHTHTICVHLLTLYTGVNPAAGLVSLLSHPRCCPVDTVQLLLHRLTHTSTATSTANPPSSWPYAPNLAVNWIPWHPSCFRLTLTKGLSVWS